MAGLDIFTLNYPGSNEPNVGDMPSGITRPIAHASNARTKSENAYARRNELLLDNRVLDIETTGGWRGRSSLYPCQP